MAYRRNILGFFQKPCFIYSRMAVKDSQSHVGVCFQYMLLRHYEYETMMLVIIESYSRLKAQLSRSPPHIWVLPKNLEPFSGVLTTRIIICWDLSWGPVLEETPI